MGFNIVEQNRSTMPNLEFETYYPKRGQTFLVEYTTEGYVRNTITAITMDGLPIDYFQLTVSEPLLWQHINAAMINNAQSYWDDKDDDATLQQTFSKPCHS